MNWQKRKLGNQKGMALIFAVAAFGAVLLAFLTVTGMNYTAMSKELNRERDRLIAIQMLQEFSTRVAEAHAVYMRGVVTPGVVVACDPSTEKIPAGRPFCWHTLNPGNPLCINNPYYADSNTPRQLCLKTGAAENLDLALEIGPPPLTGRQEFVAGLENLWRNAALKVVSVERRAIQLASAEAFAAAPADTRLPSLAGAFPVNIDDRVCTPASPEWEDCHHCGAEGSNQLQCVEMRVCINPNGCAAGADLTRYFRQVVGLIDR